MNSVISVYKPLGYTPLQILQNFQRLYPEYKDEKISYAGRLDPMAHGIILLLIGNETAKRDEYLAMPKTYEFSVLLGLQTDSYDILGIVEKNNKTQVPITLEKRIRQFVSEKIGKQNQPYPPYSSKPVRGKPLFWWARNNKLSEISIPQKEIEIYEFELKSIIEIPTQTLRKDVFKRIEKVSGDFRQKEIVNAWKKFFLASKEMKLPLLTCKITCSSGTYIRSITHELGNYLGCGAIAYEIFRTDVGPYSEKQALHLNL